MGGGGDHYFISDPDDIRKQLRKSEDSTAMLEYEASVAEFIASELINYDDRDTEAINSYLDQIKQALSEDIDGTIDLKFGGSVSKHTYVDGLSDIDSLVILDNCELSNKSPEFAKAYLSKKLKEYFPKDKITTGKLAVTISFNNIEIQLLPAVSCKANVKISDTTGNSWSLIKPKEFCEILTKVNQNKGNKVVPVVKLGKSIIAQLPDKHKITGYHAESLAVEIFKKYQGELKPKEMLKYYFKEAASRVLVPISDKTGQSIHVDEYLKTANSLQRKIISDAFNRIYRRMNNADNVRSLDDWKKMFAKN